jgi:hypothetical protein
MIDSFATRRFANSGAKQAFASESLSLLTGEQRINSLPTCGDLRDLVGVVSGNRKRHVARHSLLPARVPHLSVGRARSSFAPLPSQRRWRRRPPSRPLRRAAQNGGLKFRAKSLKSRPERSRESNPRIQLGSLAILQCFQEPLRHFAAFRAIEITTEFLFVGMATTHPSDHSSQLRIVVHKYPTRYPTCTFGHS